MPDNFNLIKFKRGTLANLQSLNTAANRDNIEIGAFYLTIDEGTNAPESARLFIGREVDGVKKVVPVNQGIIKVDTVEALENNSVAGNFQTGDFAYVESGNILAIRQQNRWVQINNVTDHYLNSLGLAVTTSGDGVSVTTTGTVNGVGTPSDSFTMVGAGGISVTGSGKAVTITGDEYELAAGNVSNNAVTIGLSSDNNPNNGAGSFDLKGGTNITLSKDGDSIIIAGTDHKASTVTGSNETQGFGIVVGNTDTTSTTKGTINPLISYLTSEDGNSTDTVHFANGTAALPVYSKTVIDSLMRGLNAMTYRGTVGATGSFAQSVSAIGGSGLEASVGDTFLLQGNKDTTYTVTIKSGETTTTATAYGGDLLVANSTGTPAEDANGHISTSNLYFDVIPSGDEKDTTYTLASITNGLQLNASTGGAVGSLVVNGSSTDKIAVDESGTTSKTLTVKHAQITTSTGAEQTNPTIVQQDGTTLNNVVVVTSLTDDGYGHITNVNTRTLTIKDTNATLNSVVDTVSAENNVATVQTAVNMTKSSGSSMSESGSFKLGSNNLTITRDATDTSKVMANFVWESF